MKVAELIEKLEEMPDDAVVTIEMEEAGDTERFTVDYISYYNTVVLSDY